MEAYDKYANGDLLHGRYAKVTNISEGSYGLVTLARDTSNKNSLVAVKFIYPLDYPGKSTLKQFSNTTGRATSSPARLRSNVQTNSRKKSVMAAMREESAKEIAIHKILGSHPHIPDLIDHFESYLVLEYCSRGDLYEAMQNDLGPTTSQDIKDVFSQIMSALEYSHGKSVYHRDLKPENILIAEDWSIKICDWGLATSQRIITNPSEFDIGSERYMAPELFDQDLASYDASKVDLWSIGVILLTLVFHKNPFQVANYSDKRFLQFSANREALFDFFSSMTGELFSALRYCLNLDPSNRDLAGLKNEINNLKYFTIDEEYWAEHSDEEDNGYEEDEEEDEDEDESQRAKATQFDLEDDLFAFDKERKPLVSPTETTSDILRSSELPPMPNVTPIEVIKKHIHLTLDEATDSDTTATTGTFKSDRNEDMPYNRRADALLSPNTHTNPIPIAGNRQIRNTRKPFGVASYTRNGALAAPKQTNNRGGSLGGKYRREDFFTPRSIFSHYMDKYGVEREQHESQRTGEKRKRWNRGRKKHSWKKHGHATPSANALSGSTYDSHSHARRKSVTRKRRFSKPVNSLALGLASQKDHGSHHVTGGSHHLSGSVSGTHWHGHHGSHSVNSVAHHPSSLGQESYSTGHNANHPPHTSHGHHGHHSHHALHTPHTSHVAASVPTSHSTEHHSGTMPETLPQCLSTSAGSHPTASCGNPYPSGGSVGRGPGKYVPPFLRSPNMVAKSPTSDALTEELDHLGIHDEEVFLLEDDFHSPIHGHTISEGEGRSSRVYPMSASEDSLGGPGSPSGAIDRPGTFVAGKSDGTQQGKYVPPFRRSSHCSVSAKDKRRQMPVSNGHVVRSIQQTLLDNEGSKSGIQAENWLFKKDWSEYK